MWLSTKRLSDDVRRWREAGWVSADGEAHILTDLANRRSRFGLASSLGILASVLLGFAVISFVAAHWQDMPRLVRLSLLLSLISAGYAAAGALAVRGQNMFADAAILFAVAAFGASIMLISQMFHIDGNPPDAVLAWALGALAAGGLLRSNAALAFAMALAFVWTSMVSADSGHANWPFLALWAVIAGSFIWQRWAPGAHVAGLASAGFAISLGYLLDSKFSHEGIAALGTLVAVASGAAARYYLISERISGPALGYGIAIAFAALFALQFLETASNRQLIAWAAITLVLLLAAIWYGLTYEHRGAVWLGYIGFSIEVLALYWKTVGTILDTSMFFLVAGLLVAALAAFAWKLAGQSSSSRGPHLAGGA